MRGEERKRGEISIPPPPVFPLMNEEEKGEKKKAPRNTGERNGELSQRDWGVPYGKEKGEGKTKRSNVVLALKKRGEKKKRKDPVANTQCP